MSQESIHDERQARLERLSQLKVQGFNPYPAKFNKTHNLNIVQDLKEGAKVKAAGRVMTIRVMGQIIFAHIQDHSAKLQIVIKADEVGQKQFEFFKNIF